jgi:flagellar biogenesis protein FliO
MLEDTLLRSFLSMIAFIAVLAVILYVFKRYAKKTKLRNNSIDLNIISKLTIQPKTNLFIIKAGLRTLLIGVTDHNIQTLSDLTEEKSQKSSFNIKKPSAIQQNEAAEAPLPIPSKKKIDDEELSFINFIRSRFKK